jgi:hypothetical protein
MVSNYLLLTHSEHPFLVNVRKDWTVLARGLLCLYGSAAFIVLPQSFSIAYISYAFTHMVVR